MFSTADRHWDMTVFKLLLSTFPVVWSPLYALNMLNSLHSIVDKGPNVHVQVLMRHRAVIAAAVVGLPHPRLEEQVAALVQVKPQGPQEDVSGEYHHGLLPTLQVSEIAFCIQCKLVRDRQLSNSLVTVNAGWHSG